MIARKHFGKGHGGFTLVEILVSITLVSIIVLALGASLRSAAQSETRVDDRLLNVDEFRIAHAFLRTVLARVSTRKVNGVVAAGTSTVLFNGESDRLAWVGVMPPRNGTGGRYFFTLAVEGAELVIRFAPWTDRPDFPDMAGADARVLASGLSGLALRYESPAGEWMTRWTDVNLVPRRVVLSIAADSTGPWPEIAVPIRPLSAASSQRGAAVLGGSE